jgi:hypothetical protein
VVKGPLKKQLIVTIRVTIKIKKQSAAINKEAWRTLNITFKVLLLALEKKDKRKKKKISNSITGLDRP